jgi:hypothetical protein
MAEHGARLFSPGDRALTHCNAGALATGGIGTAVGVLVRAHACGRLASVWVDETRPLLQGARLTAWELDRARVPHRLVTDSMVGTLMARGLVDRVVVGADRIAANGDFANKIGTYTVAALAGRHRVPFYVAAPRSTFDPRLASGGEIPIEERAAAEITTLAGVAIAPPGTESFNPAFDVTPAELVAYDLWAWRTLVRASLPATDVNIFLAAGETVPEDRRQLGVMISWRENERDNDTAYKNPISTSTDGGTVSCPADRTCHLQYIPVSARCAPYLMGGTPQYFCHTTQASAA